MTPVLCTLFDANYLSKGLALIDSLRQHHPDGFQLYVLALDTETRELLRRMKGAGVHTTALDTLEREFPQLLRAKRGRTLVEYYWTLTPFWMLSVLKVDQPPSVTYLDADSFLFGALDPFYAETDRASVAIVPHRFPPSLQWREGHNGKFNVNAVYVRNNGDGRKCLTDWSESCAAWCYQRTERAPDGTLLFGDQGYLDSWQQYYGAHVVRHLGINLAPWNQEQYGYAYDGRLYVVQKRIVPDHGDVAVGSIQPVLLYHFHGLARRGSKIDFGGYAPVLKKEILEYAYKPYLDRLTAAERSVATARGGVGATDVGRGAAGAGGAVRAIPGVPSRDG